MCAHVRWAGLSLDMVLEHIILRPCMSTSFPTGTRHRQFCCANPGARARGPASAPSPTFPGCRSRRWMPCAEFSPGRRWSARRKPSTLSAASITAPSQPSWGRSSDSSSIPSSPPAAPRSGTGWWRWWRRGCSSPARVWRWLGCSTPRPQRARSGRCWTWKGSRPISSTLRWIGCAHARRGSRPGSRRGT